MRSIVLLLILTTPRNEARLWQILCVNFYNPKIRFFNGSIHKKNPFSFDNIRENILDVINQIEPACKNLIFMNPVEIAFLYCIPYGDLFMRYFNFVEASDPIVGMSRFKSNNATKTNV